MVLDEASGPMLVEWASPSGDTALHVASRYGHLALAERVMACLNNEGPVREIFLLGWSPHHTAEAFANRRNLLGETAAHVALDCNQAPIAMMLVDKRYGMLYRVILLSFAAVGGIGVAVYSLYVEAMIHAFPGYHAACDISSWSSCSKVFTSSYSRILVHWGIANPGGYLDLSLPHLAIPYFVFILSYPRMRRSGLRARQVYLVVGS
ncbi:Vitamin K epoxide reductase complex subunit 1-like protein 1, partial [Perkinsus olseni]